MSKDKKTKLQRIDRLERKVKNIQKDLEVNLRWKQEDMKDLDIIKKKLKLNLVKDSKGVK